MPWVDTQHPANQAVLQSLGRKKEGRKVIAPPSSVKDPYRGCGSHPEIVERVWDQLGTELPQDCRCLLYRTPALVHPVSGVVLTVSYGTQYCIRLPKGTLAAARRAGARTLMTW